jgi:hypothetical protein
MHTEGWRPCTYHSLEIFWFYGEPRFAGTAILRVVCLLQIPKVKVKIVLLLIVSRLACLAIWPPSPDFYYRQTVAELLMCGFPL